LSREVVQPTVKQYGFYGKSYRYITPNIFSLFLPNKIYLCPYCAALFNGASEASFNLKQAEEAQMWDDD
jgi:acetate kinase